MCVFWDAEGNPNEAGRKSWIDVRLRAGGGAKHLMKMLVRNKADDDTRGGGLCGESRTLSPRLHFNEIACFPSLPPITDVSPGDQSATAV